MKRTTRKLSFEEEAEIIISQIRCAPTEFEDLLDDLEQMKNS